MSSRNLIVVGLLVGVWLATENVVAQLPEASRIYTLTNGSELTDDCPICDRLPIVVPMTGTFRLSFLDATSISTRYQIQDISFHAGTKGVAQYWVSGSGMYQVGGEVAVVQEVFLDVEIDNGTVKTSALCVNGDRFVTQPWPKIQSTVGQTNGTEVKLYSLKLVAIPALQFISIAPDHRTGNVRLQWESHGGQVQVERAGIVEGPYWPISPITTNQTFTDVGALTNRTFFYHLRQY